MSVNRINLVTSTTQDTYVFFQWCPTAQRGFYIKNDGTYNVGTIAALQMEASTPISTRPLRLAVDVVNTTSVNNCNGEVTFAMFSQPVDWKNILNADGVHGTGAGLNSLNALIQGFDKSQVYSAYELLHGKRFIHYPTSSVGYNSWEDYTPDTVLYNGYLQSLVPGAEGNAMSTLLIYFPATASQSNTYMITLRSQDACRYPVNTALGALASPQPRTTHAAIDALHREAASAGHQGWTISGVLNKGADILQSAGNLLGNAIGLGQMAQYARSAFRTTAPLIEEIPAVAGLLL